MESIEAGNKLIAEFCGWKFIKRPEHQHVFPNGRWEELNGIGHKELFYHSSWDWQIPAWSKAMKAFKEWAAVGDQSQYQEYIRLLDQYENAVFDNKPEVGQGILVKAITFLNTKQK